MARNVKQDPSVHQHTFFEFRRRLTDLAEAQDQVQPATKLFFVVLALMGIGLAVQAVHAAPTAVGVEGWFGVVREHLLFRFAGIVALIACYFLGPQGVRRAIPFLLLTTGVLLVLVYIEPF